MLQAAVKSEDDYGLVDDEVKTALGTHAELEGRVSALGVKAKLEEAICKEAHNLRMQCAQALSGAVAAATQRASGAQEVLSLKASSELARALVGGPWLGGPKGWCFDQFAPLCCVVRRPTMYRISKPFQCKIIKCFC
jgi:hypothetical protein